MWSLEYLKKSGWDVRGFLKGWQEVLRIPGTEVRRPLQAGSMEYLREVEARLVY
jgi:hypothetical protein